MKTRTGTYSVMFVCVCTPYNLTPTFSNNSQHAILVSSKNKDKRKSPRGFVSVLPGCHPVWRKKNIFFVPKNNSSGIGVKRYSRDSSAPQEWMKQTKRRCNVEIYDKNVRVLCTKSLAAIMYIFSGSAMLFLLSGSLSSQWN